MNNDVMPPAQQPGSIVGGPDLSQPPDPVSTEIPTPPNAHEALPKPPKKGKKKWLIVLLLLVLAGAAAYWLFVMNKPKEESTAQVKTEEKAPITPTTGKLYMTLNNKVILYDPVTKKQESITVALAKDQSLMSQSIGSNQPLMPSDDGNTILVASQKAEPGGGEMAIESYSLSIFKDGKVTELISFPDQEGQAIPHDWVLSPDGKTVYYMTDTGKEGTPHVAAIYKIVVADKKPVMLGQVKGYTLGMTPTPLQIDEAGQLRMFTQNDKEITQHVFKDGAYNTKVVGKVGCNCMFEFPQAATADGKSIFFEEVEDGEKGGFTYFVMSTETGKTTEVGSPPDKYKEQWGNIYWTSDGKKVAFDVAGFGIDEPAYEPRAEILDVNSKSIQKVISYEDYKTHNVTVMGWSLDDRLLAVNDSNKIVLYDQNTKEILQTAIETLDENELPMFGWIKG